MAEVVCSNLNRNDAGEYEDPITLDVIPPGRIVHLPTAQVMLCYDALELLRYIHSEQNSRRPPTLPDNRNPLTAAGVSEVQRVARLSFPQLYKVVVLPRNRELTFTTKAEAQNYIAERQGLRFFSYADVEDPLEEDLLYPEGLEPTSSVPIPGPYIDEAAINQRVALESARDARERANREREAREQAAREAEPARIIGEEGMQLLPPAEFEAMMEREDEELNLQENFAARLARAGEEKDEEFAQPQAGEVEVGRILAREVRPGEWRCGDKEGLYRYRRERAADAGEHPEWYRQSGNPNNYCPARVYNQLRAQGREINNDAEWGLGEIIDVQGEQVLLSNEFGTPSCSGGGDGRLNDPCEPYLLEEVAARAPRRYIVISNEERADHEIEYRFAREDQRFYCRDLDDPQGGSYDCTDELREEFAWHPVAEDPDVMYRRLTLRGPIECATKEQWHQARASGEPIPWQPCTEEQIVSLRQLPEHRGEYFREMESGAYADEVEAELFDHTIYRLITEIYERWGDPADDERAAREEATNLLKRLVPEVGVEDADAILHTVQEVAYLIVRSLGHEPNERDVRTNEIAEYLAEAWEDLYAAMQLQGAAPEQANGPPADDEDD
jgi:hypothetical protein